MDAKKSSLPVALNCRVMVELVGISGQVERQELVLVPAEQADFKSGLLDVSTPLGRLLLGRRAGSAIPYRVGDLRAVRILAVEAVDGSLSSDAASRRREAVKKAVARSEITNQMIFSTASGSKWGDYNVDGDELLKDDQ